MAAAYMLQARWTPAARPDGGRVQSVAGLLGVAGASSVGTRLTAPRGSPPAGPEQPTPGQPEPRWPWLPPPRRRDPASRRRGTGMAASAGAAEGRAVAAGGAARRPAPAGFAARAGAADAFVSSRVRRQRHRVVRHDARLRSGDHQHMLAISSGGSPFCVTETSSLLVLRPRIHRPWCPRRHARRRCRSARRPGCRPARQKPRWLRCRPASRQCRRRRRRPRHRWFPDAVTSTGAPRPRRPGRPCWPAARRWNCRCSANSPTSSQPATPPSRRQPAKR